VQTDETLCNAALAQTGSIRTDVTQNSSKRDHRRQFMPVLDSRNRRVRGLYSGTGAILDCEKQPVRTRVAAKEALDREAIRPA
jgi:hypothetical protein